MSTMILRSGGVQITEDGPEMDGQLQRQLSVAT